MSKTVKNFIVLLTVLCLIVLVVFCVELFAQNKNSGNSPQSPSSASPATGTGNSPDSSSASPGKAPSASPGQPGGSSPSADVSTTPASVSPPKGTRYEIPMSDTLTLVLYADDGLFKHTEMDYDDMFELISGGTASLEVLLVTMPQGEDAFASDYLDGYVGNGGTIVGAEGKIGQSSLSGIFVSGAKDNEKYEAWIHSFTSTDSENWGVAFVLHYSTDEQKSELYTILDTLSLS